MPDNTKNGIIDLTEIVEMGTPPEPVSEKNISASPAGTVDFESELEDLFSSTDFSEFTDSADSSSQPAEAPAADLFADTPTSEPAVEDFLADLAPEAELAAPASNVTAEAAPSFESDLDDLLDSADSQDSSVGFDADFEDLLSEFSDTPAPAAAPGHQPDFDEDLSAMSLSSADPEPVAAEPAPQPQAVAPEPVRATESNIADVNAADVDDLFADLDFELGEAPVQPAQSAPVEAPSAEPAPQANSAGVDDLFADLDFELDPMESAPIEEPAPTATSFAAEEPQASADDDLFADLGLEFDLDELGETPAPTSQAQTMAAPEPVPTAESNIADVNAADVDDLFADLDFELGEAPSESASASAPEPVTPPVAPASSSPAEDVSLDDPFDVDDILNEFSEEVPQAAPAPQDDFDLADLDELLRVDDEPVQAPRTDLTAADGTTLDSEEVEMDDIGFLLSELDEASGAEPAPEPQPEPVFEPEMAAAPEVQFEPDAPVEPVVPEVAEPAAPVDGSMFDAEIDALLDDLEMASAEPVAPISQEPPAPEPVAEPATPQAAPQPVEEPASAPEVQEDEIDLDALLESDPLGAVESPEPVVPEVEAASDVVEDDLAAELDALLNDEPLDIPAEAPVAEEAASPLGSADEFESILDELDSLLDEPEVAVDPVMESAPAEPVDDLLATPVEDVLQDEPAFDFEPEPVMEAAPVEEPASEPVYEEAAPVVDPAAELEADLLAEPTSLEEDLDSTLDRILGEEPLSADVMDDVAEEVLEPAVEPAGFTHEDIDALLSDSDDSEITDESVMAEAPQEPAFATPGAEELVAEEGQPEAQVMEEPVSDTPEDVLSVEPEQEMFVPEDAVEPELPSEPVFEEMAAEPVADVAPEALAEPFAQPEEQQIPSEELNPVSEAMDAIEEEIPMTDLAQEAMAELESLAEVQPEPVDASEELSDHAGMVEQEMAPELNMEDINENAAPVPYNASIEDLMRESTVSPPEFSDSSMEMLDTTPAVSSAIQDSEPMDVPPVPAMTPEEFAELTERIYYLESTLQNVVAMQESLAVPQPPVVEKEVLVEAIDDAFDMDGPLMARVLGAVEVRTETLIESMGTRIEGEIRGAIEQTAAKSAAQVIREELQALLAEGLV